MDGQARREKIVGERKKGSVGEETARKQESKGGEEAY